MEKKYLVVANGKASKKTNKPYSVGKQIIEFNDSNFIADKSYYVLPDIKPLGFIFSIEENYIAK